MEKKLNYLNCIEVSACTLIFETRTKQAYKKKTTRNFVCEIKQRKSKQKASMNHIEFR